MANKYKDQGGQFFKNAAGGASDEAKKWISYLKSGMSMPEENLDDVTLASLPEEVQFMRD